MFQKGQRRKLLKNHKLILSKNKCLFINLLLKSILWDYRYTHKLLVHVTVFRRADKDGFLHETSKAPISIHLFLYLCQHRGQEVRHSLRVPKPRVLHRVVQEDVPKYTNTFKMRKNIFELRKCS